MNFDCFKHVITLHKLQKKKFQIFFLKKCTHLYYITDEPLGRTICHNNKSYGNTINFLKIFLLHNLNLCLLNLEFTKRNFSFLTAQNYVESTFKKNIKTLIRSSVIAGVLYQTITMHKTTFWKKRNKSTLNITILGITVPISVLIYVSAMYNKMDMS